MGRRVPKLGLRIGNSTTWQTIVHHRNPLDLIKWNSTHKFIRLLINGLYRQSQYYVSDISIFNFIGNKCLLQFCVFKKDRSKTGKRQEVLEIGKKIRNLIKIGLKEEIVIEMKIQIINENLIGKEAKIYGDFIGDEIMKRPNGLKKIIHTEFRKIAEKKERKRRN